MLFDNNIAKLKAPQLPVESIDTHRSIQKHRCIYPLRCLIVDDDSTILEIVAYMLTSIGVRKVASAQNRPELLKQLSSSTFDLLLTDLVMPDMNGYRLTQAVKKKMPDTKTIIMTGRHKDECLEMMATQWVDGWLFKPFDREDLHNTLNRLSFFGHTNNTDACTRNGPVTG